MISADCLKMPSLTGGILLLRAGWRKVAVAPRANNRAGKGPQVAKIFDFDAQITSRLRRPWRPAVPTVKTVGAGVPVEDPQHRLTKAFGRHARAGVGYEGDAETLSPALRVNVEGT